MLKCKISLHLGSWINTMYSYSKLGKSFNDSNSIKGILCEENRIYFTAQIIQANANTLCQRAVIKF